MSIESPELTFAVTGHSLSVIDSLKTRLYGENRMGADEMRDWAHKLGLVFDEAIDITDEISGRSKPAVRHHAETDPPDHENPILVGWDNCMAKNYCGRVEVAKYCLRKRRNGPQGYATFGGEWFAIPPQWWCELVLPPKGGHDSPRGWIGRGEGTLMRIKDLKSYSVEMGDYWSESAYLISDLPAERNAETAPPEGEWVVIYYRKPHPRHKETKDKLQVGMYLGLDKKGRQVWMGPIPKGSRTVFGKISPPSSWTEMVW